MSTKEYDIHPYNEIALNEFGLEFNQLGDGEKEWVKDEFDNNY